MKTLFKEKQLPKEGSLIVITDKEMKTPFLLELDKISNGTLKKILYNAKFEGEKHQIAYIAALNDIDLNNIVIASVGDIKEISNLIIEETAAKAFAKVSKSGITEVKILIDLDDDELAAHAAFGAICGNYDFDKYKTKNYEKITVEQITVLCNNPEQEAKCFEPLSALLDGMFMARDLVSEPGNVINPQTFAQEILKLKNLGLQVEIIEAEELKKKGFGLMLSVGVGSDIPARLAVVTYKGKPNNDKIQLAVVGKGVTFDTGGISLKPVGGMEEMKMDMGGAAAAVSLMKTLALRKAEANVVAVAGLVENMPSGKASRPGDVVKSLSGQTVEIITTDAEGRMVLGDALWYTQERFKPEMMIDFATLTGAMIITLGYEKAGLFSNNNDFADKLFNAGEKSGENLWRFPLSEKYDELINSDIADMKNYGGKGAGSITAAQFLQRFVKDDTKWTHLDIASTAWIDKDKALYPKGATGFGVRLIDRFVKDNLE